MISYIHIPVFLLRAIYPLCCGFDSVGMQAEAFLIKVAIFIKTNEDSAGMFVVDALLREYREESANVISKISDRAAEARKRVFR